MVENTWAKENGQKIGNQKHQKKIQNFLIHKLITLLFKYERLYNTTH